MPEFDLDWLEKNKNIPGLDKFWGDYQTKKRQSTTDRISELDPKVENRFDDYADPYSYEDMEGFIDEIYGQYEGEINRSAKDDIADLSAGAASRFASQGITGGAALNEAISGIGTDVNKNRLGVLGKLKTNKAQSKLGLMGNANDRNFAVTGAGQNVDLQNFMNELKQLGMLSDMDFRQQYLDITKENQEGWLEDLMSGVGDAASIATSIAALASDRRLKENIELVGSKNGINIYEFNYLNNSKRFRGVMADEIVNIIPDAVVMKNGFMYVDYSKTGIEFQEV